MKAVLNFKDRKSAEANVEVIVILNFCVFTVSTVNLIDYQFQSISFKLNCLSTFLNPYCKTDS